MLKTSSVLWKMGTGLLTIGLGSVGLGSSLILLTSVTPKKEIKHFEPARTLERVIKKKKPQPKAKPKKQTRKLRKLSTPKPSLNTDLSQLGSGVPLFAIQNTDLSMDSLLGGSEGENQEIVMSAETVDTLPQPLSHCKPRLSRSLIHSQQTGWVKVKLLINAQGQVDNLHVLESQPRGLYDQAVIEAMQGCRWKPASYKGRPTALQTYKTFRFKKG